MISIRPINFEFTRSFLIELKEIDATGAWAAWSDENFLFDLPMKFNLSLALMEGTTIIGFLIGSKKDKAAHIHRFVIHPQARSKGHGAHLLGTFMTRCAEFDSELSICTLKVARDSTAIRLYQQTGFRDLFLLDEGETVWMWRALAHKSPIVAVHQPNYLPWHGYFAKLAAADIFVLLEDVQMPAGRSYVSRTPIRQNNEEQQWMTVPVKKRTGAAICEIDIADLNWFDRHNNILRNRYSKFPFFAEVEALLQETANRKRQKLWKSNADFILAICKYLGLQTVICTSGSMDITSTSDDRIIEIVKQCGSSDYLSGAGGMNYQSHEKFTSNGIQLHVQKFTAGSGFSKLNIKSNLTVLESLFALGAEGARAYLIAGSARIEPDTLSI